MLNKVMILTDSTCDLNPAYIIKEDIQIIPLFIRFQEQVYRDGLDILVDELFSKVKGMDEVARSTGLRSGDFHNAFNKYLKRGYDIVYIGVGSNLSSSIQSSLIAKQELETSKIWIVDSKTISSGLGLCVMEAVRLRNQGKSAETIKTYLDQLAKELHFYYMISDLDLLRKTSRIKPLQYRLGKIVGSKPIVSMINYKIEMQKHPMVSHEKMLNVFVSYLKKVTKGKRIERLMITHSMSEDDATLGFDLINTVLKPKHIDMYKVGCVLGAQIGPLAFGCSYVLS